MNALSDRRIRLAGPRSSVRVVRRDASALSAPRQRRERRAWTSAERPCPRRPAETQPRWPGRSAIVIGVTASKWRPSCGASRAAVFASPQVELPVPPRHCHAVIVDRPPGRPASRDTFSAVTLHDAIVEVLRAHGGGWMDRDEIAAEIARRDLYRRADGAPPPSDQIRLRARKPEYRHLFECSDTACSRIRLRPGATPGRRPPRRQSSRKRRSPQPPRRGRARPRRAARPRTERHVRGSSGSPAALSRRPAVQA